MERRKFLHALTVAASAAPIALSQQAETPAVAQDAAARIPRVQNPGELRGEMVYRPLGSTGETVSAIGMGGSHLAKPSITQAEATRLIHQAVDRGITFLDNCWDYNEGRSEQFMGEALSQDGYRKKVFLMTKLDGRNKDNATDQLHDCNHPINPSGVWTALDTKWSSERKQASRAARAMAPEDGRAEKQRANGAGVLPGARVR